MHSFNKIKNEQIIITKNTFTVLGLFSVEKLNNKFFNFIYRDYSIHNARVMNFVLYSLEGIICFYSSDKFFEHMNTIMPDYTILYCFLPKKIFVNLMNFLNS